LYTIPQKLLCQQKGPGYFRGLYIMLCV
jgi:hypothetical protein